MFAVCKCQHHLLCNSVPFSLWTVFTNRVPLFLLIQVRGITIVLLQISLLRETSRALDSHSFLLSSDPHEMSLNIDMKIIRPENFSRVTLNLGIYSWTLWQSCNVVNRGKIFHSNSTGSPSILSNALYSDELLKHVNLSSHAIFDCGFLFIFPRHITESEKT